MLGSTSEITAADLCRRCSRGDEQAFSAVYERFGRRLYGTALRLLGDPDEAEDAVQETFLTFYEKSPSLSPRNLGGWLHRVTTNHCLDRLRARTRRGEAMLFEESLAARPGSPKGARLDVRRAVERLPERARMVFVLHDVEGFKHREIANLLEITEGTSKSQLFRARETLRDLLSQSPLEASE